MHIFDLCENLYNRHISHFQSQAKPKPKKDLSLEEAIDDSENLTDFLLDFETEE